MHFINKIIENKVDDYVHNRFVKFSKGTYKNAGPVIQIKSSKKNRLTINGSYEYEDLIGLFMSKNFPEDNYTVSGTIYTQPRVSPDIVPLEIGTPWQPGKRDLKSLFLKKVQQTMTPAEINQIYEQFSDTCYLLLSISPSSGKIWTIKTKENIPSLKKMKDGNPLDECKPETQVKCKDIDFCTETEICLKTRLGFCRAKTGDMDKDAIQTLYDMFLEDFSQLPSSFTELKLVNQYYITSLVFPPNRDELSARELREKTKRAGTLHRVLFLDGKKFESKIKFEA
ncbi:MAG: hypothetical protein ACTSRW_01400 [Candidatus Helarchaeota archaeon]